MTQYIKKYLRKHFGFTGEVSGYQAKYLAKLEDADIPAALLEMKPAVVPLS